MIEPEQQQQQAFVVDEGPVSFREEDDNGKTHAI